MRPIRAFLVRIIFSLLQVEDLMKGIAIYEDLPNFDGSKESIGLSNGMKYKHSLSLAKLYMDDDYKNYLYYLMMKLQRDNIKTVEPFKRDAQTATVLFILKHINDMKLAHVNLSKQKGPKFTQMVRDTLKRKKKEVKIN